MRVAIVALGGVRVILVDEDDRGLRARLGRDARKGECRKNENPHQYRGFRMAMEE